MKYRLFFITLLTICLPATSHAQVLLSEIAWMGSDADPSHEWIELYNFSNSPTDLTGWTLTSEDGAIDITLTGTLSPHGVGVLERGGDSSVPGVTALQIYTGEMNNAGGSLTLKNASGTPADAAPGGTNWTGIGGKSTAPIKTSQRTRTGSWITAAPTPGLENAQVSDLPTDTTVGTTTTTTAPTVGGNTVTKRGGGGSSQKKSAFNVTIIASTTAYTGKPAIFKAVTTKLDQTNLLSQSHYWNFGDTVTSTGTKVTHSFEFPGEYVVMVESSTTRNKSVYTRHDITVLPHALALATTTEGNIVITNVSAEEFTLDGYTLSGEDFKLVFPRNSILKSKAAITLARTKLGNTKTLKIIDLDDFVIARLALSGDARLVTTSTNTEVKAAAGKRVIPYAKPVPATVDKPTAVASSEPKVVKETVTEPGLLNKIVSKIARVFQW